MIKKFTRKGLNQIAERLLELAPLAKEYERLEAEVKQGLAQLKLSEIPIDGKGRVFVSTGERVSVPPALVRAVLAPELASKVIQVKESVPNDVIKALVTLGEISPEQREQLLAGAERTPVTSLYVRPLQ